MNIVTQVEQDGATVLALDGRFDAHEVGSFRPVLETACRTGTVVRLDLAAVRFIDSTALAELLRAQKACQVAGGQLQLQPISDPVRVILELTGLDSVFATAEAAGSVGYVSP